MMLVEYMWLDGSNHTIIMFAVNFDYCGGNSGYQIHMQFDSAIIAIISYILYCADEGFCHTQIMLVFQIYYVCIKIQTHI